MSSAFTAGIHREFRHLGGVSGSMSKETVWVVFGDVYNSDSRIILCPDEDETADISLWGDPAYATVNIGPEIVTGPVLYDKNVHIGWGTPHMERTIMVHAGSQLPLWLDGPLPGVFGWRPLDAEDMPIHARVFEADVLLLVPKEHGVTGWIRTIHLPRVGRPMERMTIPLGLGTSATAPVRVLAAAMVTDVPRRAAVPELVVHTDVCIDPETLLACGWRRAPGIDAGEVVWGSLLLLSDCFETVSTLVGGRFVTDHVAVRDFEPLDAELLPLLPEDVRMAIAEALGIDSDAA